MAAYYEVLIQCRDWSAELASDALLAMGSLGTVIQDIQDVLTLPKVFGEVVSSEVLARYPDRPLVTGYFPMAAETEDDLRGRLVRTFEQLGMALKASDYALHPYEEQDWSENWKQYYHPLRLSHWLTIIPAWEAGEKEDPTAIYLNPGMAFGTGSHPTTRLIINLLEIALNEGDTVIDVGTGSGILALVAAKLGAKSVGAYDYDASVLATVQENIALNPGITNITVAQKDKLNGVNAQVDLITANILADILRPLIPQAYTCLKPNGAFLLSGIYHDQFQDMLAALSAADFYIVEYRRAGDWYAIYARKGRQFREKDTL